MLGYNFSECTRFFPQGLNPFKIHRRFKFCSVPEFISWLLLIFWSGPNLESWSEYLYLAPCKIWIFLEQGKSSILNLQFWAELEIWKKFLIGQGPPVSSPTVFISALQSPDPRCSPLTRSPCGDHAHGGECTGAGHHRSSPLPVPGRSLSGRTCVVEGFLPSPFILPHHFWSALLYFWAATTRRWLARVLATHSLTPSASSFAKGSWCFCIRFCSSSSTLPSPALDNTAVFCWPPVSSLLHASHC
jgi:hypothetical protein